MAEDQDQESKTEEPTEKRIADAIKKGNVPVAREATLFGSIAAILGALVLLGSLSTARVVEALRQAVDASGTLRLDDREATATFLTSLFLEISLAIVPIMAVVAAGTIIASLVQNVPSAAGERITPRANRISLLAGWTRLFGKMGMIEFLKSVIKLSAVGLILWVVLKRDLHSFASALSADPFLLPGMLLDMTVDILIPLLILALALAIADLVWSRLRWRRELRMTQHDVRQEMKEAEGDPFLKARARNIARQRSSHRMLEHLPTASMVITNPTHYAVALRYERGQNGAPVVVAKGVDHLALRIREIATEHAVPLVENRPLARGLYEQVDVDEQIPPEFYRAVAEIIHYLNSRGRLPRQGKAGTSLRQ
jgi:flagellar biosynthesis protein FlhB